MSYSDKVDKLCHLDPEWFIIRTLPANQIERIYETVDKAIDLLLDIAAMRLRGEPDDEKWFNYTILCGPVLKEFPQLATLYPFAAGIKNVKEMVLPFFTAAIQVSTGYTGDQEDVETFKKNIRTVVDFSYLTFDGLLFVQKTIQKVESDPNILMVLSRTIDSLMPINDKRQQKYRYVFKYLDEYYSEDRNFQYVRAFLHNLRLQRNSIGATYVPEALNNDFQFDLAVSHYVRKQFEKFYSQAAIKKHASLEAIFNAIHGRKPEELAHIMALITDATTKYDFSNFIFKGAKNITNVCEEWKTHLTDTLCHELLQLDRHWGYVRLPPGGMQTLYDIIDEAMDCFLDIAEQHYLEEHYLNRHRPSLEYKSKKDIAQDRFNSLWERMYTEFAGQLGYFPFIVACDKAGCVDKETSLENVKTLVLPFFNEYVKTSVQSAAWLKNQIPDRAFVKEIVEILKKLIRTEDSFGVFTLHHFNLVLRRMKKNPNMQSLVDIYVAAAERLRPLGVKLQQLQDAAAKMNNGIAELATSKGSKEVEDYENKLAREFGNLSSMQ